MCFFILKSQENKKLILKFNDIISAHKGKDIDEPLFNIKRYKKYHYPNYKYFLRFCLTGFDANYFSKITCKFEVRAW
jgi:hypothetical protein